LNPPEAADIARLVAEHHAWVYRAAYRLCGSVADAEDLTQQTFLTAQRALAQLREPAAARGWLGAILRTGFLKGVRKRRPLAAESHDVDLQEFAGPIAEGPAIDGETLEGALAGLSDDSRLILTMYYFEELSYREIAAHLDVPIGTVMSRLSRAKEQLRRRLAPLVEGGVVEGSVVGGSVVEGSAVGGSAVGGRGGDGVAGDGNLSDGKPSIKQARSGLPADTT